MLSAFSKNTLVPLLLRFALAAIFVFHGFHKVGDPGNEWGAAWMKLPEPASPDKPAPALPPAPVQLAVAWGELIGGIALAFGFLTRLAAIGIIIIMAGAIATVHGPQGFDLGKGGFEYNFAIIVMCLCLVLGGPGPLAVDYLFRFKPRPPR
jgi:putative oxidoreductase